MIGMRKQKDFQPTLLHSLHTQGEQGYKNKVCNLCLSAGKEMHYVFIYYSTSTGTYKEVGK